ncbi:MAG: recombination protein RecR [Candidatus Omnitrophica bacterium CG11_big_fil_rev_8_21_14_0_20_42_13]|uniref:Recombination protein RecR n=1 Tax=Candidatus Ghiorseimicrobium undicola TaxID=1974746 RepID=A0A2H0LXY8_9BACT|nr:MAG: recombination protein RecR [Candidatus Omnitrophica bacterium CG11_big_fil_rev_8_21_14_0_20_42_13]
MSIPEVLRRVIDKFMKFPGVGRRSAERMAHFVLNKLSLDEIKVFSEDMIKLKESIKFCSICHNISEEETCSICRDQRRDKGIICVVEDPRDVIAIEKAGGFQGVYHVLLGALSPLDGRGPEDLTVSNLVKRLDSGPAKELIIATDSDTEGEATALYISRLLKGRNIKLSRIGMGIPLGSNIEYADGGTIMKALEARREL